LRELARYANVHIFSESEDVLYAARNFVALHTVRGGTKSVRLPRCADVWETYSNRLIARDCTEFSDYMDAGTTLLYYYGPAPGP
jgi:hypothetical protein